MASDVPVPEVLSSVSVEPAPMPPMCSGDVNEVVNVGVASVGDVERLELFDERSEGGHGG